MRASSATLPINHSTSRRAALRAAAVYFFRRERSKIFEGSLLADVTSSMSAAAEGTDGDTAPKSTWVLDDVHAANTRQADELTKVFQEADHARASAKRHLLGAAGGAIDPSDLLNKAQNITDVFHQSRTIDGQQDPASYVITTIAVPVSCQDGSNNVWEYYYLAHQCLMSCGTPACTVNYYELGFWNEDFNGPQSDDLVVIDSSPQTTEGATSTTSSISQTISGNLGFFAGTATGGLSGSGTFGKSTTFSTPDVKIENQTNSGRPQWVFRLQNDISHSTFQPYHAVPDACPAQ